MVILQITIILVHHSSMIGEKPSYELAGIFGAYYPNWTTSRAWVSTAYSFLVPLLSTCCGRPIVGIPSLVCLSFVLNLSKGYSPLDFTVLDPHYGNLQEWQDAIDEIHARGMYFMADFTVGTMGDLIGDVGCVQIESYYPFFVHIFEAS